MEEITEEEEDQHNVPISRKTQVFFQKEVVPISDKEKDQLNVMGEQTNSVKITENGEEGLGASYETPKKKPRSLTSEMQNSPPLPTHNKFDLLSGDEEVDTLKLQPSIGMTGGLKDQNLRKKGIVKSQKKLIETRRSIRILVKGLPSQSGTARHFSGNLHKDVEKLMKKWLPHSMDEIPLQAIPPVLEIEAR